MSRTCRKPVSSPSDFECGELHHQSCRGRSRGGGCGETSFFKESFSRFYHSPKSPFQRREVDKEREEGDGMAQESQFHHLYTCST